MFVQKKIGVILLCKLARHDEQISKLSFASLFQILQATFLPNIIRIGLQFRKLSPK